MSQHIVRLSREDMGDQVTIQLGWDKPYSEFYLVVFGAVTEGQQYDEGEVIYSNSYDQQSEGQELDYFKAVAKALGCDVPDSMWRAAYQDREFNIVNKTVYYSPAGVEVEPF